MIKPTLVVAGPGAGKTHGMVDQIEKAIQELSPCRQLAAITYTNAATHEIRERLARRVCIPGNVFIGTTHSFLSRFILRPFATLLGQLPEDRIYVAFQSNKPAKTRNFIKSRMKAKGVIPYEDMLLAAAKVIAKKEVRSRVGARLQFIFVDEFQDVDTRQLKIFEQLRLEKRTKIYVVGDPEQFISSHSYAGSGLKVPEFNDLPFNSFKSNADVRDQLVNHRANGELVEFTNRFRQDIQQKAKKPKREFPAVYCASGQSLDQIITRFRELCLAIPDPDLVQDRLYLSFLNRGFDRVRVKYGIKHAVGNGRKSPTLLGDASELLSQTVGLSPRKIEEACGFNGLTWRKHCLSILKLCRTGELDEETVWKFAIKELGLGKKSSSREKSVASSILALKSAVAVGPHIESNDQSSSIHRAKGLQADAVLALASTQNELMRWLETTIEERTRDRSDTCRLGYVAATRARELLCYGCEEELDPKTKKHVLSLGIVEC